MQPKYNPPFCIKPHPMKLLGICSLNIYLLSASGGGGVLPMEKFILPVLSDPLFCLTNTLLILINDDLY